MYQLQKIFKSPEHPNYRYVDSLEEAMLLLKKYEQETTTKFSCYKSDKMFGSGGKTFSSQKGVGGCTPLNLLRGCAICTRTFLQTKRDELMTLFQTMGTLFQIIGTKEKKITTTTTITTMIIIIIMIMIIIIAIIIKRTTKFCFDRTHSHLQLIDIQRVGS